MTTQGSVAPKGRSAVKLVFGLFVALGLILVFAGTLTRSTALDEQAGEAQAQIEALRARVAAGSEEVEFVKTDEFVTLYARRLGYGEKGETAFSLEEDAPPPVPVIPLGMQAANEQPESAFEAWMSLLFDA